MKEWDQCICFCALYTVLFKQKLVQVMGTFKRAGLQWFSSNKHTLQFFSNQAQTAGYNGWLQQVL